MPNNIQLNMLSLMNRFQKLLFFLYISDKFKVPERPVSKPLRISVSDIYKGTGSGFCISGRVEAGMVQAGDKVLIQPQNEIGQVKG